MKPVVWIPLLLALSAAAAVSQTTSQTPSQAPPQPSAAPDQATVQSANEAFRAGHAAMEQNNLVLAHTEFAKVVQLLPQVAAGHSALGAVLYAEGNPSAAVPELEQAHSLDPSDTTATLNLALSYSQLSAYNKALPLFQSSKPPASSFPRATSSLTPAPSTPPVIPSPPAPNSPQLSPRIPTTPPSTTVWAPSLLSRTS